MQQLRKPRRSMRWLASVAIAAPLALATATPLVPAAPAAANSSAGRFVTTTPTRLLDTRTAAKPGAGAVVRLVVRGSNGVPANASAVVVNVTATQSGGVGFLTVFPGGTVRPTASNLNLPGAGATLANLVTVPVGADGSISVFTDVSTHLIVDLFGFYEPVTTSDRGRFQPISPTRAFDSRYTRPVARGATLRVNLGGVPTTASAVVLNVTAIDAPGHGFWTVHAAGSPRPGTSNLNTSPGATVPNQVIVPVTAAAVDLYSEIGGHVAVDVAGYYTGAGSPVSSAGLFTPIAPTRFLDTRRDDNPLGAKVKPYAGWTVEVGVAGRSGVPSAASAIVTNTTAASARNPGFVTSFPAGTARPVVSTLNLGYAGHTVANHAIVPVTGRGMSFYTDRGTHLIVDVAGYFSGSAASAIYAAPANPEPKVSFPGRIEIPRIGLNTMLRSGIDLPTVDAGPSHWPSTAGPGGIGNVAIFGHRVSHTHPFRDIDDLAAGDSIYLTAEGVTYRYQVIGTDVTLPSNIEILNPYNVGQRTLTLIACHPPTSIKYRIVVKAKYMGITAS